MIGELVDHYRVQELVGCGAMGVVYKALDVNLDRQVAVKVMGAAARLEPDFVERFRQEARLQGALTHPNVALLFDYFVHDGAPVAVMEYIDGESLEQLIARRGAVPARECLPLFKQALCGVAAAHRAGIIHRDLKPSNLMVTRDGVVKVMDFGIAKRQGVTGATKVSTSTSIGSPLYMAPEQILGRPVDCRTDVYALGITLYELLSGQRPFNPRGKTEYSVLNAHVNDLPEPPTVHCRDIPGPVVDAVLRALAKEPEDRFQSVDDFMRALPEEAAAAAAAVPPAVSAGAVAPAGTVAVEYAPPASRDLPATGMPRGTVAFEYAPSVTRDLGRSMAFDYSAATLRRDSYTHRPVPSSGAVPQVAEPGDRRCAPSPASLSATQELPRTLPPLMQRVRTHRPAIAALLVAMLVLGTLIRHAGQPHEKVRDASLASSAPDSTYAQATPTVQPPTVAEPVASPAAVPDSVAEAAAPAPATAATAGGAAATPLTTTTAPSQPDLTGTWRGEYVDASGRQRLRVVSLSISRVRDDGGIEGTLQYRAASGDGECHLRPRGSTYWASEQRLQLSPERCSPHYPRELGVPLDFAGVNPRANTLKNGRIEAPTGEVIRVRLTRVGGV